ncbi:DUF5666 domain-containing protein [Frankia sp. EAN1pec]|uniref:DUF5666 domain-containing protein n=1 Tax=Parafrankia sp. (strain EAN1pec) TaxID=298653 RepID=UPI0012FA928F
MTGQVPLSMSPIGVHPARRSAAVAVASAAVLVTVLAGCGGSSGTSTADTTQAGATPGQGGGQPGTEAPASGLIAEVDSGTIQVQSQQSGQIAVKYGESTTFTETTSAALSDVKEGVCVTAANMPAGGARPSGAPAGGSGAQPSARPTAMPTSFTATTVMISQPTDGSCAGPNATARPTGQPQPSGQPQTRPSGGPDGPGGQNGQGAPGGQGGFGGGGFGGRATGKVTSVSGSTITISGTDFGTDKAVTYTVLVDGDTKYTQSVAATSTELAVGKCAVANGDTDDTGTVTATRIALSEATNGACATGFGGGFGGRGSDAGGSGSGGTGTTNG